MKNFSESRAILRAMFGACVIASIGGAGMMGSGCGTSDPIAPPAASTEVPSFAETEHAKIDAGDGETPSPCTTPPLPGTIFCDDFDEGKKVSFGWTSESDPDDGGVGRLGKVHYASAPASFRAENGYTQEVNLSGGSPTGYSVDFDLRLHKASAAFNPFALIGNIQIGVDSSHKINVLNLVGGATATSVTPFDTWVHEQIVVSTTQIQLYTNGVLEATLANPLPQGITALPGQMTLGAFREGTTVNFDNVLVRSPAPIVDAGAPDSGASDSGAKDSGVTTYCSVPPTNSLYCDDFDLASEPSTGCVLDSTVAFSAPDSCALASGGSFNASVTASVSGATDITFELYVKTLPTALTEWFIYNISATAGDCPVGTVQCSTQLLLYLNQTGTLSYATSTQPGGPLALATITPGTWNSVEVSNSSGRVPATITVNGAAKTFDLGINAVPGPRRIQLLPYGANSYNIDNVDIASP